MKRIIILFILAIALLGACGDDSPTSGGSDDTAGVWDNSAWDNSTWGP